MREQKLLFFQTNKFFYAHLTGQISITSKFIVFLRPYRDYYF